jgi:hypothetical protein
MAGIFKGSFFSSLQENHQFFSKSDVLKDIGLSSFTLRSCSQIYNSQADEIKSIFSSAPDSLANNQTILNIANVSQGSYIKFDKLSKRFDSQETIVSLGEVTNLINYHEDKQLGSDAINTRFDNLLLEINNSFFKCLRFRGSLFEQDILVTLFFQNKNRRSNERTIANKNSIMVAAPPVTPFGKHYSIQSINNAFQENFGNNNSPADELVDLISINDEKHNFAYPAKDWPTAQSNFYENSVAAPVQLSYDQNTNTWKSGNPSVLARLLEDLEAATLKDGENLTDDRTNINDWIDENSDIYVGGFTVGTAVPLSIEKSNPYLFSPNFVKEKGEKKVATMKVVNRSARSYKKGDLVMLTEINGEWIPQGFDSADVAFSEPGPAQLGEWTFIKLVANSDAYFKYDSFRNTGAPAADVRINTYELGARNVFFQNVQSVLARSYKDFYSNAELEQIIKLNDISTETIPLVPSRNYLIASIFDQLPKKLGGFGSDRLKILRNNNRIINQEEEVGFNPSFFWGTLYTQGYRSLTANSEPTESNLFSSSFVQTNLANEFGSYFVNDETGRREPLSEIPAEMTSKFFDLTYLFNNWLSLGSANFDLNRATATIKPPYYGSVSNNNNVQFSAISLELIGSNYNGIGGRFRGSESSIRDRALILAESISELAQTSDSFSNLLGNMIARSKASGYQSDAIELLCDIRQRNTNPPFANKGGGAGPAGVQQPDLSTFNCPGRNPSNDGASIVGIIGAKNTISKSGGSIIFSVDQNFGSLVSRSVSGGQGPTASTLPLAGLSPFFTPGNDSRTTTLPTWGASQDNPWNFGTLALHVRVFNEWPENQTVFDPRYFAILHFNPGILGSVDGDLNVDFLVPTSENNRPLRSGTIINDTFKLGTPIKNTIRRGQLLTNGGFWYFKNIIGLNQFTIADGGENFSVNDEVRLPKGAIAVVTSVDNGKLTGFKFKEIKTDIADYELRGENVLPTDFNTEVEEDLVGPFGPTKVLKKALRVSVSSPAGGKPAIINFSNGIVYRQALKDVPPFEHTGGTPIRLTDSSNRGNGNVVGRLGPTGYVQGNKETSVGVSGGSRRYDCFFHFHNDAGIYSLNEIIAPQQHIILKVS